MASSIIEDIAALEEQHRYGCLTDLEFAAAVARVLPARECKGVRNRFRMVPGTFVCLFYEWANGFDRVSVSGANGGHNNIVHRSPHDFVFSQFGTWA